MKSHPDLLFVVKTGRIQDDKSTIGAFLLQCSHFSIINLVIIFYSHYICVKNSGIGYFRQQDSKIIDTDVNADEVSLIWSREGHAESLYGLLTAIAKIDRCPVGGKRQPQE